MNLLMGFLIHAVTDLDWITSFMCAVPGGMSDTPIIAADMGGNGGKVAVMQFARLLTGIGVFPSLILTVTKKEAIPQQEARVQTHSSGCLLYTSRDIPPCFVWRREPPDCL